MTTTRLVEHKPKKKVYEIKVYEIKFAKLRRSCDSFCVHNLEETTIVCTIAIDNFYLQYCNLQIVCRLLELLTFVCAISIHHFWMDNCMLQNNVNITSKIDCINTYKLIPAL